MDSDFGEFRELVRGRANHIRQMIITYSRRLEILELQHAQRGNQTDPATIMEIQDIRAEVDRLRRDLQEAETNSDYLKRKL